MKERLKILLLDYLRDNNPDLFFLMEETQATEAWLIQRIESVHQILLSGKPDYIIEEECMDAMTKDLRPSKYLFVKNIFENEFPEAYQKAVNAGILTFEVVNMLSACRDVSITEESENDSMVMAMVAGIINDYLQSEE